MKYYSLEPEVAGGLGDGTVMDSSVHPPHIEKLQYVFDGWPQDGLITSFPCFLVIKELGLELYHKHCSGFHLESLDVSTSDQFSDLYEGKVLPDFFWLKVNGVPAVDDFFIDEELRLVVSEKALEIIKLYGVNNADIEEISLKIDHIGQ